jgi:hypothetical protein
VHTTNNASHTRDADKQDNQWGVAGPSTPRSPLLDHSKTPIHSHESNSSPTNPVPPQLVHEDVWRQLTSGELYQTIAGAGEGLRQCVSTFEKLREEQTCKGQDPWDPFQSLDEWELARWLVVHGVSKSAVDELLKLKIVGKILVVMQQCATKLTEWSSNHYRFPRI